MISNNLYKKFFVLASVALLSSFFEICSMSTANSESFSTDIISTTQLNSEVSQIEWKSDYPLLALIPIDSQSDPQIMFISPSGNIEQTGFVQYIDFNSEVLSLEYSRNLAYIAIAGFGTFEIWNLSTDPPELLPLSDDVESSTALSVSWSPDSNQISMTTWIDLNYQGRFLDLETGDYVNTPLNNLLTHPIEQNTDFYTTEDSEIRGIRWNPRENLIAVKARQLQTAPGYQVQIWDVDTAQRVETIFSSISTDDSRITDFSWSPTGEEIAILSCNSYDHPNKCVLRIHSIDSWEGSEQFGSIDVINDGYFYDTQVEWSPNGQWLLVATSYGAEIWDAHNHELLATLDGSDNEYAAPSLLNITTAIAWSPDSHMVVLGSRDGTVRFWEIHTYD